MRIRVVKRHNVLKIILNRSPYNNTSKMREQVNVNNTIRRPRERKILSYFAVYRIICFVRLSRDAINSFFVHQTSKNKQAVDSEWWQRGCANPLSPSKKKA